MATLSSEECRQLLSAYKTALTARIEAHRTKGAGELVQLDSWRLNELSNVVRTRKSPFMTKDELEKLMECKLSRGKFRPRLKQLISSNPAAEVKSTTQNAFKEIGDKATTASIVKAVKVLSELKGVGPATATMMLQAASDDVPFMSDEAMLQVFNGDKTKLKYDVKTCEAFTNEINKLVTGLNEEFNAAEVERALYTRELVGTGTPAEKSGKRASDPISPSPTESKRKKIERKDESTSSNGTRRTSSRLRETASTNNATMAGTKAEVSSADKAIGVPRVGVGVVVLNKENKVLIGKRKSPHGQGTWSLPGGHLEFFEAFEYCARREILEETNLVLADDLKFVSAENNFFKGNTPQRHYVTICMAGHVVDEEALENTEPDKCEGWEWVSASDLVDDSGKYRPLFVPLRHIFLTMGLIQG